MRKKMLVIFMLIVVLTSACTNNVVLGKVILGTCNPDLSIDENLDFLVTEQKWVSNTTLAIKMLVRIDCNQDWTDSGHQGVLEGDKISLGYQLGETEDSCKACPDCPDCIHEISYVFTGLEEKDYMVEVKTNNP